MDWNSENSRFESLGLAASRAALQPLRFHKLEPMRSYQEGGFSDRDAGVAGSRVAGLDTPPGFVLPLPGACGLTRSEKTKRRLSAPLCR